MGNRFSITGTLEKASTGRSLKIEIVNRVGKDYVSIKDIQELLAGHKKSITVWRPNSYPDKPKYTK